MKNNRSGNSAYGIRPDTTAESLRGRKKLLEALRDCPVPEDELLGNLGLFLRHSQISRILGIDHLYKQILDTPGIIMEFGVRWGRDLAMFQALRALYEPANYNRTIVGFDTFQGFPSVDAKDGQHDAVSKGAYSVSANYEQYLAEILNFHEGESPYFAHKQRYELVKGDATVTIPKYLKSHPEAVVALAFFDFDLFEPTRVGLKAVMERVVKGSIIAFDDINDSRFPGETVALRETIGLKEIRLVRMPFNPYAAYFVVE